MTPWFALSLILTLGLPEDAEVRVRIVPDAWPARPRATGYEYNQKNHQAPPRFVPRKKKGPQLDLPLSPKRRFRVIGVRVDNDTETDLEVVLRSPQIRKGKKFPVTVPALDHLVRYFAIREPEDRRVEVEVLPQRGREPLVSTNTELAKDGHVTGWSSEALAIAKELEREDRFRRELRTRPVALELVDDLDKPVPDARLVLLLEEGLMVYEGRTDDAGRWQGSVLPGAYTVFALAEVPDRTDRSTPTIVPELPRLLALRARLEASARELRLKPDKKVAVTTVDPDGIGLTSRKIWITPEPLAEAYRYALIAERLGSRGRVASERENPGGSWWLLTSSGLGLGVTSLLSDSGSSMLLSNALKPADTALTVTFAPEKLGRMVLDPATGVGPGRRARVDLVAASGHRESLQVTTSDLHTIHVTPGDFRLDLRYELFSGERVAFLPYRVPVAAGELIDLTPRGPFDLTLYFKRKDKKMQFWLSVRDAFGRILNALPTPGATLEATTAAGRALDRELKALAWELPAGLERTNLERSQYRTSIPFGEDSFVAPAKLERTRVFNVEGSSGHAPGVFEDRMLQLLPEVKRALEGSLRFLGLPEGMRRLHMEFDIFLPPGVGGLGGGGQITLDVATLFPFTHGTDSLPGAFRHELGHNLGFGHDPYMLLAPAGVDEERFSSFGYRMLHADDFQRTLSYLQGDRQGDDSSWAPGAGVYAGLRLLYGPEVHLKMIQERKVSAQTLNLHELSSIEQIATLYSLSTGRNLAWIFRAHGWPVFDHRIDLGGSAARTMKKHPRQLNYTKVDGTAIDSWWVFGPVQGSDPKETRWRFVQWPGTFISIDENRPPHRRPQKYILYRKLLLPKESEARVLCASDVQLEIRVNGAAVGTTDASPQYAQPVHDELMLNQKRSFTVPLFRGENHLEVAVIQPRGAKGFRLELITPDGKPLKIGLPADGPMGEDLDKKPTRLALRNPVYNSSFEHGKRVPDGWVRGAVEGKLDISLDPSQQADGERTLRYDLQGSVRGGIIQRIVVTPGKRYKLSAAMRTEGLDGEAYVSLFTGDINDGAFTKTTPIRQAKTAWKKYGATWFPGDSRVVYVACYVKGTGGTVWFDTVSMEEVR